MVETGHPGAGAHGGARRASASAGTEARARSEDLWGCGGVCRALLQSWLRERRCCVMTGSWVNL